VKAQHATAWRYDDLSIIFSHPYNPIAVNYQEFNQRVFDFYLARAQGDYCYLSLDDHDVSQLTDNEGIPVFPDLLDTWQPLLTSNLVIPSYFGLLGIQCHAAYLMHEDEFHSAQAYKDRLRELLALPKVEEVQRLCSAGSGDLRIQEEIWMAVQMYFRREQGLSLEIPKPRRYAGRYTQYPTSQCLFNREDISRLTLFFDQHFELGENIPFRYFEKVFNQHYSNLELTPHSKEVLEDPTRSHNALRQLYISFNNWNGTVYSPPSASPKKNAAVSNRRESGAKRLLLIFEQQQPVFYEEEKNSETLLRKLSTKDITVRMNHQWVDGNTLFFQPMEYFHNEYEASRFIYKDKRCYILIDTTVDSIGRRYLERSGGESFQITANLVLYQFEPDKMPFPLCFVKHEGLQQAVSLAGGLRINRRREYLVGFGPSITAPQPYLVFQQHKRIDYIPENAGPGTYVVRLAGLRDTTFTIVGLNPVPEMVPAIHYGWNITRYQVGENPSVEGCLIYTSARWKRENLTRQWINRLTGSERKPYQGPHSLLRMLNHIK